MKNIKAILTAAFMTGAAVAAPSTQSPFACNTAALSPAQRKQHFEVVAPQLRKLKTAVRELPNGYAFAFPNDAKTFAMLAQWVEEERRCCPFFEITLRFEKEGGPLWMELTGRPGTKQFIEADARDWVKR